MKQSDIINVYTFLLAKKPDLVDNLVTLEEFNQWEQAFYPVRDCVLSFTNIVDITEEV